MAKKKALYDRDEWYTPAYIIELVRRTPGIIALDPASNEQANKIVQAEQFYTKEQNALTKEWHGDVWCNPPYSRGNIDLFAQKIAAEYINGCINSGLMLVNNATETDWFQMLLTHADAVCFLNSRVQFYHPERTGESPRQGQAVFYFGRDTTRFQKYFSRIGTIIPLASIYSYSIPTPKPYTMELAL